MQSFTHYFLHLVSPGIIAYIFFRTKWKKAYVLMMLAMMIDLDHLLATPIFEVCRCSINFHPLHSYWAIAIYVLLLFFKKTRVVSVGLLLHIMADSVDCIFSSWNC
jgi:hypothetical protein